LFVCVCVCVLVAVSRVCMCVFVCWLQCPGCVCVCVCTLQMVCVWWREGKGGELNCGWGGLGRRSGEEEERGGALAAMRGRRCKFK